MKIIGIAADHAGFELKEKLKEFLIVESYDIRDFGTDSNDSCDYPDFAHPLAKAIMENTVDIGISICGSGNGINMVVNKYSKIRSALCWNVEIAGLAVAHNNANICALPARFITFDEAKNIVITFLNAKFEGGRHQKRIEKIPLSSNEI
jgi:ribose 5-phosphate isomerase B